MGVGTRLCAGALHCTLPSKIVVFPGVSAVLGRARVRGARARARVHVRAYGRARVRNSAGLAPKCT